MRLASYSKPYRSPQFRTPSTLQTIIIVGDSVHHGRCEWIIVAGSSPSSLGEHPIVRLIVQLLDDARDALHKVPGDVAIR
jgi:hypothetical protein